MLTQAAGPFFSWLRPRAGDIDQNLDALRGAFAEQGRRGLLGLRVPLKHGGQGLDRLAFLRFQEGIARVSGALAFLQTQHQSACGMLAACENTSLRDRLLPGLAGGHLTAGIAFSHLRRPGAVVSARPGEGGFIIEGEAPWVTGWGIFDRCVSSAKLPDGRALFFVHALTGCSQLQPSAPMRLAAFGVTQTVSVRFEGLVVPAADVLALHPSGWLVDRDRRGIGHQAASVLGCAGAALDVLRGQVDRRGLSAEPAEALAVRLSETREALYAAIGDGDGEAALEVRAAAIVLMGRCAHAAVAASAGAANLAAHPAQRIWREALLLTVQSQNRAVREETLSVLAG